jgi:hypothetical protein
MKKLLFTAACAIFLISSYGQSLEKGNAVGQHIGTVNLNSDVTYNQWKSFIISEWLPALNKEFNGDCKAYFIEGERGHYKGSSALLLVFTSVEARNKYWPEFQKSSDAFNIIFNKLLPLKEKFDQFGEFKIESSSGWIVQ